MIVTCERCATQFQLDDERVPEDGVRVRCSRCKHAFFIERPARNEAERIHRIARRALEDTPDTTHDLDGGGDGPDPLDEEDWQFADDAPFGGGEEDDPNALTAAAATHVVDDLLGAAGDAPSAPAEASPDTDPRGGFSVADLVGDRAGSSESLGLAGEGGAETEPSLGLDAEPDAGGYDLTGPGLDALGADDPTSLLADLRDELGGQPPAAPTPEEPPQGLPLSKAAQEAAPAPQREVVTQPTRKVVVPQDTDELGTLDEWGLADEVASPGLASGLEGASVATLRVPTEVEEEPTQGALWLARAGNLVGWLSVLALFTVGLHSGVTLRSDAPATTASTVRVGGFELAQVATTWIDNLHVGPLLVISGTLRNESAPSGSGLTARLLGADGRHLEVAGASVGPALGEALLRGGSLASLAAAQAELRPDGWPWRPGDERRFVAISPGVPDAAVWVRFEPAKQAPSEQVLPSRPVPEAGVGEATSPAAELAPHRS